MRRTTRLRGDRRQSGRSGRVKPHGVRGGRSISIGNTKVYLVIQLHEGWQRDAEELIMKQGDTKVHLFLHSGIPRDVGAKT